jgi:hypothetical protein
VIGYGVFATRPIPQGTITWVGDPLDQVLTPFKLAGLPPALAHRVETYSYLNGRGERILCWDHGRYVNHSCSANCLSPGYDFEVAVRDIAAGEELTDDYGTLNLERPFACSCGTPACRGIIMPDDMLRLAARWDALVAAALPAVASVNQPMWELVKPAEREALDLVLSGHAAPPSCRLHYLAKANGR